MKLFENDQEKREAVKQIEQLREHPGWKFVTRAIDQTIEQLVQQLRETTFQDLSEVRRIQDRITDLEELRDSPAFLLRELENTDSENDPDPYDH